MPFLYGEKFKNKLNECNSLQVQRSKKEGHRERVFLYSLNRGSITLEAAIALPIFLLTVISIIYFIVIMNLQINLQIKIEECARKIAKNEYITHHISGYTILSLRSDLMSNDFNKYLDKTSIVNGAKGISLIRSSFNNNKGIIDIVLDYKIKVPFIPGENMILNFAQRCRFKTWIGSEIKQESEEENKQIVYVTLTGTVYHSNRNCSHLNLSIKKCDINKLNLMRNENGGIYKQCLLCKRINNSQSQYVYITESGDSWHKDIGCSGLKRSIIAIEFSEVGDKGLCQRCKEGN